eukprot:GHVN01007680.1.p2 GENE.GHVN01007680.1~~GHVN01007680.1.p2  ORF type:complete len:100 (-),score=13.16 GHVN01007680.1:1739-2038(-)
MVGDVDGEVTLVAPSLESCDVERRKRYVAPLLMLRECEKNGTPPNRPLHPPIFLLYLLFIFWIVVNVISDDVRVLGRPVAQLFLHKGPALVGARRENHN